MKFTFAAASALLALSTLSACGSGSDDAGSDPLKVALFSQVDVPVAHEALDAFKQEFIKSSGRDPDSITWIEKNAQGESARCQTIARELSTSDIDGVAVVGTPCIVAMAGVDKQVPIFPIAMSDPIGAKVAKSLDEPGTNVSGSTRGTDAGPFLDEVLKATPAPKTIGIVYDQSNPSVTPWVDSLEAAAKAKGLGYVGKGVTSPDQIPATVRTVVPQIDTMILAPDGVLATAAPVIASTASKAGVPVFTSGIGRTDVAGIVAEIGPTFADMGALAAGVAIKVIIDGDKPASIPFVEPENLLWTVNEKSADDDGVSIPAAILASATKVE